MCTGAGRKEKQELVVLPLRRGPLQDSVWFLGRNTPSAHTKAETCLKDTLSLSLWKMREVDKKKILSRLWTTEFSFLFNTFTRPTPHGLVESCQDVPVVDEGDALQEKRTVQWWYYTSFIIGFALPVVAQVRDSQNSQELPRTLNSVIFSWSRPMKWRREAGDGRKQKFSCVLRSADSSSCLVDWLSRSEKGTSAVPSFKCFSKQNTFNSMNN